MRIKVPDGQQGLILARFSADSECYRGGTGTHWCSVKIVAQNASGTPTLEPDDGDFAFDNTKGKTDSDFGQSHSMDRSALLGPGTYTVKVKYRVSHSSVTFELDDWSPTVEKAQVPLG